MSNTIQAIYKAAMLMDKGKEQPAVEILEKVIREVPIEQDPINVCEAHLFLAHIAIHQQNKKKANHHLEFFLSTDLNCLEDQNERAERLKKNI